MWSELGAAIAGEATRASRALLPYLPSPGWARRPVVHLVNPLINAYGGSENRSIELARSLAVRCPTLLWSDRRADPRLHQHVAYRSIVPPFRYPTGGNLVFVGIYFRLGAWLRYARPQRVIAIFNTPDLADLRRFQGELVEYGLERRVEFVYASQWLRELSGIPGEVHPSIIDLKRFKPSPRLGTNDRFVVGRLSRDVPEKHHPEDPELWIELARRGFSVRLMGATCIAETLRHHPGIEILPVGAEPAENFLNSLDALVYRTDSSQFVEPSGRVILEALSCGVPVVCDRNGGYRESVVDGYTGLYADNSMEIIATLETLRGNPDLYDALARHARRYVEDLFSEASVAELNRFFID